jgi:glyoxylase-like metal-dependent hydrolase (beta-lactamase superfamily II)
VAKHQIIKLVLGDISTNCWIVLQEGTQKTRLNEGPGPLHGASGIDSGEASPEPRPCTIIDPADHADLIIAQLQKLNAYPEYILLTHGHFDHIAALPDLAAYRCAGSMGGGVAAKKSGVKDRDAEELPVIAIHKDDAGYLGEGAYAAHCKSFTAAAGNADYVDSLWKPMPAASRLLEDGDKIGPFDVLYLPGHTPGSAGFLLADEKVLFSGDTLFRGNCGRVDLPGGSQEKIEASLQRLFSMDPEIRVLPGHGPETGIGQEQGSRFF